jgi:molecular chaperone GrpE
MSDGNGKVETQAPDAGHELPAAEAAGGPDAAVLEAELQKTREERDQLLDRLARAQAEFENTRRRGQREQREYRDYALAGAIKELLPVLDSFDRALASPSGGEEFRSGMALIDRSLHDALARLGVEEIAAQGEPFDPTVHEAIGVTDSEDVPDQHVLQVLQRGYKLKGRLLRPAMVRVARKRRP